MTAAPPTTTDDQPRMVARLAGRLGSFHLDVELDVPLAGITVLSGPSGSGKSTLLRCIAGLQRMSGRLAIDGAVWQEGEAFRPAHRRDIGLVFQDARLLPHLSVQQNLTYGARRAETPLRMTFDRVVDLLGLGALIDRGVAGLSGGERQAVAIGRALLAQPRLLLLDEPTVSLDQAARARVLDFVASVPVQLGIPVLYVTHDEAEAIRLGDRQVRMDQGRITGIELGRRRQGDLRAQLAGLAPDERDALALAALTAGLSPLRERSGKA